ncbi:uncharacterized protein EV154DRAFT_571937 [Mucor mucedo]|uniref:uncharacterized protein n=1 Tax=Mucor mucedo TaxID=29922 RepID=UPI00222046E7|nr:uncharacterized protein EV154DRAFT_571937 [Mucor mucedo]KAI7866490.1 hypothetical protein EV154DRAFT_571937 [Mucor mucedo]
MKKTHGTNNFRAKPALPPQEQTCVLCKYSTINRHSFKLHQRSGHHLELLEAIQSNQGPLPTNDIQQQNTFDEQPTIPLSESRSSDMKSIERPIQPERTAEPFESNKPPVPVNEVNNGSDIDGGGGGDDGNDEYLDLNGDSGSFKYSEVQIKSVLDIGKYMAEIAIKKYRAQLALDPSDVIYDFCGYPTPHSVSRFHKSKKSCIPCFPHAPRSHHGTATAADASAPAPASTSSPASTSPSATTSAPATDPAATTNTTACHDPVTFYAPNMQYESYSFSVLSCLSRSSLVPDTASTPADPVVVASKPDLFLNDVSEHLRLLVGNPCMSGFLSDLPDRTPNQRIKLSQGEKWSCDRLFEHPMIITGRNLQLWVRIKSLCCLRAYSSSRSPLFKVAKIFQISKL